MVKRYEKHKQDLQRLKRAVKAHNDRALYREIFQTKNEKLCNYVTYCGKGASGKTCTYEEFQKYLTKKLEKYEPRRPGNRAHLRGTEKRQFFAQAAGSRTTASSHTSYTAKSWRIF